jgi:hypothetical protein
VLFFGTTRKHSKVVGLLYYAGFFLLFFCLGTFGSAGLITYKATKWPATTAEIQDCSLSEYGPVDGGMLYALTCGVNYPFSGRSYKNTLQTNLTHSLQERAEISKWITLNRPTTLNVRVNPSYPSQFIVMSQLPGKRGDNAGDFINAAIIMGSVSAALLVTARALVRRGW